MKAFWTDLRLWERCRWQFLAGAAVCLVFAGGVVWPGLFSAFGVYAMHPIFSDLIAILAAGEAAQQGWDVYASNPLDPLGRPHVYGPWWLVTGKLGLLRTDAWWIGLLLLLVFVVATVALLAPRNRKTACIAILLLVSPPVLLAMERGNNDLIIFLLLAAAAWLATRVSRLGSLAAAALIVLAAALKLYPVAGLVALAARKTTRKRMILLVTGAGLVCGLIILSSLAVYQRVAAIAPEPLTIFGYGAKLSYHLLPAMGWRSYWMLAGEIPVFLFFIWVCWRWRRDLWNLVPTMGFTAGCYVAGAICWCLCYTVTINFPYRMVLLLLPARLWLQKEASSEAGLVVRLQWMAVFLLFWTPRCIDQLLTWNNYSKDYFDGPPFSWMLMGMEQSLATGVTITLAFVLLGWGWRRLYVAS